MRGNKGQSYFVVVAAILLLIWGTVCAPEIKRILIDMMAVAG